MRDREKAQARRHRCAPGTRTPVPAAGTAMSARAVGGVVAVVVGVVFLGATALAAVFGDSPAGGCTGEADAGAPPVGAQAAPPGRLGRFDAEQIGHTTTITTVGVRMGVPVRGQVIAVAVAIQESGLRNLAGGPDDSAGLFQQRPSQGWGSTTQVRDPQHAAGAFYTALLGVAGWQQMALTDAAQAVQRSAYPHAYARHEADATMLVSVVSAGTDASAAATVECAAAGPWVQPVSAGVVSGFRTPGRPVHDGVDLGAARGTPIRAASAGVVSTVRCNVNPPAHGCDVDGSPQVRGCGWYVDIEHADAVVTRYCHMQMRPRVQVGESVAAGQILGVVGSSGNSSGPHLHFEVHLGDHTSRSAVDPVPFMAARCAPLGQPVAPSPRC
jgi:murein DD-endopeptidase MepM/ murein hydrolase activator NlpD